jgi:hypothetical protein
MAPVNLPFLTMLQSATAVAGSGTLKRMIMLEEDYLKTVATNFPWQIAEFPYKTVVSTFIGKLKAYNQKATLSRIPNGVAYFLKAAANLMASAVDVCFNPDIVHHVMLGKSVYDSHPAFDEYFNLLRQVTPMCHDLRSAQPTFLSFQCAFLLQITGPAPRPHEQSSPKETDTKKRKRTRKTDQDRPKPTSHPRPTQTPAGPTLEWIELVKPDDKEWRITAHKCILVEGSLDASNMLCWNHVASGRTCKMPNCKYRHPKSPTDFTSKDEAQKLCDWVKHDNTIRWMGNTKKEGQAWIGA